MGEALEGFEDGLRSPWKQHSKQSENVSDIKKINIYWEMVRYWFHEWEQNKNVLNKVYDVTATDDGIEDEIK